MKKKVVAVIQQLLQLLLLTAVINPLASAVDSFQMVSFRKSKTTQNGSIKCALDPANETISSSSLQDCSLNCTRDATCASFNIKDSNTCDLYNYQVKVVAPVDSCVNYQVPRCSSSIIFLFLYHREPRTSYLKDCILKPQPLSSSYSLLSYPCS